MYVIIFATLLAGSSIEKDAHVTVAVAMAMQSSTKTSCGCSPDCTCNPCTCSPGNTCSAGCPCGGRKTTRKPTAPVIDYDTTYREIRASRYHLPAQLPVRPLQQQYYLPPSAYYQPVSAPIAPIIPQNGGYGPFSRYGRQLGTVHCGTNG